MVDIQMRAPFTCWRQTSPIMGLGQRPGPGIGQIHYSTAVISSLEKIFSEKSPLWWTHLQRGPRLPIFNKLIWFFRVLMKCLQHWLKFLNPQTTLFLLCQLCSQRSVSVHVSLNANQLLLTLPLSSIFCVFGGALTSKTKIIHGVLSGSYVHFYIQLQNTCITYETLLLQLLECTENDGQRTTDWGQKYANTEQSVSGHHTAQKIKTAW